MDNIKVSVITVSLNVADYIRECIDSILAQTLKDIEVICVDGGSTDGTEEILKEYAENDTRVRFVHAEKKSVGYQLNLGIRLARGKYIGYVETDDSIMPEMYEDLYKIAEYHQTDFVKGDYYTRTGDFAHRQLTHEVWGYDDSWYDRVIDISQEMDIFEMYHFEIWTGLYRTEWLRKNRIKANETMGASYQDAGFYFLTFVYAKRAYFTHKPYYMYRIDNPNASISSSGKVNCICTEFELLEKRLREDPERFEHFKYVMTYRAFYCYRWNLDRIDKKYKEGFLEKFSEDFRRFYDEGMLDFKLLYNDEPALLQLYKIILNPLSYYRPLTRTSYDQGENPQFVFPYHLFPPKSKVLIYGAGSVGRSFYVQAKEHKYVTISGIVDKNAKNIEAYDIPVRPIEDIPMLDNDYILIAIEDERIAKLVKEDLRNMGIAEKAIAWDGEAYQRRNFYRKRYFKCLEFMHGINAPKF